MKGRIHFTKNMEVLRRQQHGDEVPHVNTGEGQLRSMCKELLFISTKQQSTGRGQAQGNHQIRYGRKKAVLLAAIDRKAFGVYKRKIVVSKDKETQKSMPKSIAVQQTFGEKYV